MEKKLRYMSSQIQNNSEVKKMRGIYFIASGRKYIEEARKAIKNVKRLMPQYPIALCSDSVSCPSENVDYYIPLKNVNYNFLDKVKYYYSTPFEETLFLDTDTYLVDSIDSIFDILERFDIAAPHAPIEEDEFVNITDAFPEMNSGVILYKKNEKTKKLFSIYEEHYRKSLLECLKRGESIPPDQPSFRYALYYSDVNLSFLPHEYNCMLDYPCFLSGKVHILHGHYNEDYMRKKIDEINSCLDCRIYHPCIGIIGENANNE